jgi:hypothetical protein
LSEAAVPPQQIDISNLSWECFHKNRRGLSRMKTDLTSLTEILNLTCQNGKTRNHLSQIRSNSHGTTVEICRARRRSHWLRGPSARGP